MSILKKVLPVCLFFTFGHNMHASAQKTAAMPHSLVYKTTKDYSKYVAVELTDDKKHLAYYPAPTDMDAISNLQPVKLHGGYLLSKTGVSTNTAYLNVTREAYAKLKKVPTEAKLLSMVKYKSAIKEICDCGVRNEMSEQQINELIDKGELKKKCKKIK